MRDRDRNEKIGEAIRGGVRYILKHQTRAGHWSRKYPGHSDRAPANVYATAVACLILQMPHRKLPMTQYK